MIGAAGCQMKNYEKIELSGIQEQEEETGGDEGTEETEKAASASGSETLDAQRSPVNAEITKRNGAVYGREG